MNLAEVATQLTDKVLTDKHAGDGILDAARAAAFAVYEDEGHRPAALAAAVTVAKAHEKKIHAGVMAEAKTRKNAIVKTKTDVQGRTDIETGVVQQVKDDEVGKRSVDAAIKGSTPEEGMAKLGHFFDFMAPERGWMDEIFGTMGYVDALREVNREGDQYSWWPESEQAELLNLGWRFDYQILTPGLRRFVRNAKLPRQPRFSQHAPLIVDYDWTLSI